MPDTNQPTYGSVREFIGARYVPIFAGEWSDTRGYEALTVVQHQGNSYTSTQPVPPNTPITDAKFWALTGNYNAQVEQYYQIVQTFDGRITDAQNEINENIADISALQGEVAELKTKHLVVFGDQNSIPSETGSDYRKMWYDIYAKQNGFTAHVFAADGAVVDNSVDPSRPTYLQLIQQYMNDNIGRDYDPDEVVVQLGSNDYAFGYEPGHSLTSFQNAEAALLSKVKTVFGTDIKIRVIGYLPQRGGDFWSLPYSRHLNQLCNGYGVIYHFGGFVGVGQTSSSWWDEMSRPNHNWHSEVATILEGTEVYLSAVPGTLDPVSGNWKITNQNVQLRPGQRAIYHCYVTVPSTNPSQEFVLKVPYHLYENQTAVISHLYASEGEGRVEVGKVGTAKDALGGQYMTVAFKKGDFTGTYNCYVAIG